MEKEESIPVKTLVLDLLKPHKPSILKVGKAVCEDSSVENVSLSVYAVDEKTESVKAILEGKNINFDQIKEIIEENGSVIHSMDKVVLGKKYTVED